MGRGTRNNLGEGVYVVMPYQEIMEMLEGIRSEYISWIQHIEADDKKLNDWSEKVILLDTAIIIVNKEKERNQ